VFKELTFPLVHPVTRVNYEVRACLLDNGCDEEARVCRDHGFNPRSHYVVRLDIPEYGAGHAYHVMDVLELQNGPMTVLVHSLGNAVFLTLFLVSEGSKQLH
jgi:hypothetical protein